MKIFKGLSNNIYTKKNLIIKKSKKITLQFLDHQNESYFYSNYKNDELDKICVLPFEYKFKDNHFISKSFFLKNWKNLLQQNFSTNFIEVNLKQFINIIKIFSLTKCDGIKKFPYKDLINFWADKKNLVFTKNIKYVLELIDTIEKGQYVICHNDMSGGNFLTNGKDIKLIDFEWTYNNHWLFDYCSFISETLIYQQPQLIKDFVNLANLDLHKEEMGKIIFIQNFIWYLWAEWMYKKTKMKVFKNIAITKEQFLNINFFENENLENLVFKY